MPIEFSIGELGYILAFAAGIACTFQVGVSVMKPTLITVSHATKNFLLKARFELKKRNFKSLVGIDDMLYYPSYASGKMQALLHSSYGFTPEEIFILQRVIDWYLPIIEKKNDLKKLLEELAELKGRPYDEKIHFSEVDAYEWTNLKQMLNLMVCALEHQYNDIAVIKERTLSHDDILLRKERKESFSATSPQSPNDLFDQLDTLSLSTDEELVLSEIEPSSAQKHIWQKLRTAYVQNLAPLFTTSPTKKYQAIVVVELERAATLSFLDAVIASLSLSRDLNEATLQQLIIGYTYETPSERLSLLRQLQNYLQESALRIQDNFDEQSFLNNIVFIDMSQPRKNIHTFIQSQIYDCGTEQLLLISYPEQHVFTSYFEKLNLDVELLSLLIMRDCVEGFHPEHWLQTLRQIFRLKDSQHRKDWRDSLEHDTNLLLADSGQTQLVQGYSEPLLELDSRAQLICYSQRVLQSHDKITYSPV